MEKGSTIEVGGKTKDEVTELSNMVGNFKKGGPIVRARREYERLEQIRLVLEGE